MNDITIKEVEKMTWLSRSNVRFYEKEKLIVPVRNERNGYRDYSNSDIENLKKIAYLRTLGISIEDIRSIISENVSLRDKKFIFAYPIACIVIRYFVRPIIYGKLQMNFYCEVMTEYLTNYMCFLALSVELFSILFIYGIVKNIIAMLVVDTVVLIGVLIRGLAKKNSGTMEV